METKTCPNCGADVPSIAYRCKECFHDFDAKPTKSGALWPFLMAFAFVGLLGGGTIYWLSQQHTDQRTHIDTETRTIKWITQYQDGRLTTDTVSFDQVTNVEYRVTAMGKHEIAVLTTDGDRKLVEANANQALTLKAEHYAEAIGKPLKVEDETSSFLD